MTDFSGIPGAPQSSDLPLIEALASDLAAARYTVDGVADFLGESAAAALGRDQLVPALLRCREEAAKDAPAPVSVMIRLWLAGEELDRASLEDAFALTRTEGLLALGLLEPAPAGSRSGSGSGSRFRAAVDLRPYEIDGAGADDAGTGTGTDTDAASDTVTDGDAGETNLWVASDLGAHQRPGVLQHDHVLGIGQASLSLARLTVRRKVDRALDLGTGCGIQAFHLLGHARHITATDISERALAFARFNLLLNSKALDLDPQHLEDRVSLRLGSLLEPVAGESFDLVVSNPPFVITPRGSTENPEDRFTYRDGGLAGDEIVATLVRNLHTVLVPGGTAQMLGNWEIQEPEIQEGAAAPVSSPESGDDAEHRDLDDSGAAGGSAAGTGWSVRLQSWLPPETDAWVIQREVLEPAEYAEMWLRDAAENRDRAEYLSSYAAYLADFASRQVSAVGFGSLFLRRRADPEAAPLRRFEEITHALEQPVGPHLGAAVARFDWLAARPSLADEHLEVAEDVTEERHARPGAEHPGVILLRQGAGLRRTNLMSTELTGFVSASDGELSVGQIIGALAALLGRPDPEFARGLEAEIRNLVLDGFLLPAAP